MASLPEIALGLIEVLKHSPTPEPLSVDFRNHLSAQVSFTVKQVIDGCASAGVKLALVRIDPDVAGDLWPHPDGDVFTYHGVPVEHDDWLGRRVEFYRELPVS